MRQTIFAAIGLLLTAVAFTANAQIKIVGDEYSESLSATKNYYEQDLVFDSLFPRIDFKEKFKTIPAWTNSWEYDGGMDYSLVGDTFFIPTDIPLTKWDWNRKNKYGSLSFVVKYDGGFASCLEIVPSGYYVISGYVFCNGGALRKKYTGESDKLPRKRSFPEDMTSITDDERIKEVKECFLVSEQEVKEKGISECLEYDYVILQSISDTNIVFYCRGLHDEICGRSSSEDNRFRFFNVAFYSEFKKYFLGKEVSILKNGGFRYPYFHRHTYPSGIINYKLEDDGLNYEHEFIKPGEIITDAMNNDKLKILDSVFVIKDIVMKGTEVYCILEGEKTGAFALTTSNINYTTSVVTKWDKTLFEINNFSKPYFHAHYPVEASSSEYDDNRKSLAIINLDDYNSTKVEIESQCNKIIKEDKTAKKLKQIEEEKARLQREKNYRQAKAHEQAEFMQRMIAKYGAEKGSLIGKRQVTIGMTPEMVRDAWRRPMNTYRTMTKYGQSEVWCYNYKTRVYFYNGKVVQIDN